MKNFIGKLFIENANIQINIINEGNAAATYNTTTKEHPTIPSFIGYSNTNETTPDSEIHVSEDRVYSKGTNNQDNESILFEQTLAMLCIELAKRPGDCDRVLESINGGQIELVDELRLWAWEFETRYKGQQWGIDETTPDWYEAIDAFIEEKVNEYNEPENTH